MNLKPILILMIALFVFNDSVYSQTVDSNKEELKPGLYEKLSQISLSKPIYLSIVKGEVLSGTIKNKSKTNGLVKFKFKTTDGKELKLSTKDVLFMYLPLDLLTGSFPQLKSEFAKADLDMEIINEGYVYYETNTFEEKTLLGVKKQTELVELLNPDYSSIIQIYDNPYAHKSSTLEIDDKEVSARYDSYYIIKGSEPGYKIQNLDYKKSSLVLFADCPKLIERDKSDIKWKRFFKDVLDYTTTCVTSGN